MMKSAEGCIIVSVSPPTSKKPLKRWNERAMPPISMFETEKSLVDAYLAIGRSIDTDGPFAGA
ncbi:MAG: hypothetical protein IPF59_13945 [Ignavibacteria bacterium]|nr:hypothetical protein [Ignavibacteria bacterium]